MVYPVHNMVFKINTQGRTLPGTFVAIADLETFELGFDNGVEEWTPMDTEGWIRRLMTAKSVSVALNGKRNYGDIGNDYVAGKAFLNGSDTQSILQMVFPDGDTFDVPCILNVSTAGGGDSTSIGGLEFECLSDGKPTYVNSTANMAALTFVCSDGTAAGATKIASVSPILDALNSYYIKINGAPPMYDEDITNKGWVAYTLAADILTAVGNNVSLVEVVTASKKARKFGASAAVIV